MFILCALFWLAVAACYPFSESYMWHDVDIDMSNIDVVITLANGSTPHYGTVVNTEADVPISNMAITFPNGTVINTGPMILYISTYHQDIYDIIMPAAGYTEDFVIALSNNALIIAKQLQMNSTISQSFGGFVVSSPEDNIDNQESEDSLSGLDSVLLKRYKADFHGCYMKRNKPGCDTSLCHHADCYCKTSGFQRCKKTSHLRGACGAVACKNCICKVDRSEWAINCITQITGIAMCCSHVILTRKNWCRPS